MIQGKRYLLIASIVIVAAGFDFLTWLSNAQIELLRVESSQVGTESERALHQLQRMCELVARYYFVEGYAPDSLGDVIVVAPDHDLRGSYRVDPWNREILFEWTGPGFVVRSIGADGVDGPNDDIVVQASVDDPELAHLRQ